MCDADKNNKYKNNVLKGQFMKDYIIYATTFDVQYRFQLNKDY
jgi:hypothetical protein